MKPVILLAVVLIGSTGCAEQALEEPASHPRMSPVLQGGQVRVTTGASGSYLGPEPVHQVVPNRSVRPVAIPPTDTAEVEVETR
ncbi:MAG: hypothetical protein SFU53_11330 [Terrimicrobiaceae bacterium]|nr:hypothetical protein [Terrimicrobiaceae bacterium]